MKSKKLLMLVLAGLLLVVGSSCNSTPPEKTQVNIVMAPYFGSWVCTYAAVNGLVTSDKVDVTIDQSARFDDQLMAGNYPIGSMNTAAFAIAAEKSNISFKAVSIYLGHQGIDATNGVAIVYALEDSDITGPADLKGKKVGIPGLQSTTASTFFGMLKLEYGISETELTAVDSAPPQLIELLNKGDIDAVLLLGDPSIQSYYNPGFKVVWNVDKAFEQRYGTYDPATLLAVDADFLASNRDTVREVYELLDKSRQYGEAHLSELSETYVSEFGGDSEFYQNAYKNHYSVTFSPLEGKVADGIMAIFGFVKDRGIISNLPLTGDVFEEW